MLTTPPIWVVAAALVDPTGLVLVQQRPAGKQHGGLWEFPGGKVEPGETPRAALARELAEELAIGVAAAALSPVVFADAPPIVLLLYLCRDWDGEPMATDGALLRWVDPAELEELPMPPADLPLVAALRLVLAAPSR